MVWVDKVAFDDIVECVALLTIPGRKFKLWAPKSGRFDGEGCQAMTKGARRWMAAIVPAASVFMGGIGIQAQELPPIPTPNPGSLKVIPLQISPESADPSVAPPVPNPKSNAARPPAGIGPDHRNHVSSRRAAYPSGQSLDFVGRGGNRALMQLHNPFEGNLPEGRGFLGGLVTPQTPVSAVPGPGTTPGVGMAPSVSLPPGTVASPEQSGQPTAPMTSTPAANAAASTPPPGASSASAAEAFSAAEAAGPTFGGTLASAGGTFAMIGDQGAFRFHPYVVANPSAVNPPRPPRPPSPRASSVFYPSVRNFKVTENMSPRPQDRIFYDFNYYDNLNGTINRALQVPVTNIKAYRSIWGAEKTFNDGKGSVGFRLPLNTVTADSSGNQYSTPTSTSLGDLSIFGKYILEENKKTGSLISVGLAITPPTGPQRFAGAPYLYGLNTLYIQPFLGWIWNSGRFYMQGFSAFDFPSSTSDVSMMYNDVGFGYFVIRSDDPNAFLTALAPTFEVHVNSPLNHRDPFNRFDFAGTPDAVNLTYGLNFGIRRTAVLTTALITPVASPKPFDVEWTLLLNIYYGRTRNNVLAQIPPVVQ